MSLAGAGTVLHLSLVTFLSDDSYPAWAGTLQIGSQTQEGALQLSELSDVGVFSCSAVKCCGNGQKPNVLNGRCWNFCSPLSQTVTAQLGKADP